MRSTPARRELGFVLGVAVAGVLLVIAVVFAPWYPVAHAAAGIPDPPAAVATPMQ